jgi:hypothetical protein
MSSDRTSWAPDLAIPNGRFDFFPRGAEAFAGLSTDGKRINRRSVKSTGAAGCWRLCRPSAVELAGNLVLSEALEIVSCQQPTHLLSH